MQCSKWKGIHLWGVIVTISFATACASRKEPPVTEDHTQPPPRASQPPVAADLSTPEGPMQAIFQAAREKNYELFRSAFSDTVPRETLSKQGFIKLVKRVKSGLIEQVPGAERVSDTEAIVKLKVIPKNKVRQFLVRKIGDRWLIVGSMNGGHRGKRQKEQEDL